MKCIDFPRCYAVARALVDGVYWNITSWDERKLEKCNPTMLYYNRKTYFYFPFCFTRQLFGEVFIPQILRDNIPNQVGLWGGQMFLANAVNLLLDYDRGVYDLAGWAFEFDLPIFVSDWCNQVGIIYFEISLEINILQELHVFVLDMDGFIYILSGILILPWTHQFLKDNPKPFFMRSSISLELFRRVIHLSTRALDGYTLNVFIFIPTWTQSILDFEICKTSKHNRL